MRTAFVLQRAADEKWTILSIATADGEHAIDEANALAAIARARAFGGKWRVPRARVRRLVKRRPSSLR